MNQFIIIPIIFALQAIYRYLIVMKNVKIGYMRLALIFCLGNLIHWVGSQNFDFHYSQKLVQSP